MQLDQGSGLQKVSNCHYPDGQRHDSLAVDTVAEEAVFQNAELALCCVNDDPTAVKAGEERLKLLYMFCRGTASDKDISNVCINKGEATGDLIRKPLKRLGSVPQPKRHM